MAPAPKGRKRASKRATKKKGTSIESPPGASHASTSSANPPTPNIPESEAPVARKRALSSTMAETRSTRLEKARREKKPSAGPQIPPIKEAKTAAVKVPEDGSKSSENVSHLGYRQQTNEEAHRMIELANTFRQVSSDPGQNARWNMKNLFDQQSKLYVTEALWPSLKKSIREFASSAFHVISWDLMDAGMQEQFLSWAPRVHDYIQFVSQPGLVGLSSHLFEAWIWHILCEDLFLPGCVDKWKPGPWAAFGTIHRSNRGSIQSTDNSLTCSHYRGKLNLARQLYMLHGQHSDPDRLTEIIHEKLRPFIEAHDQKRADFYKQLGTLVKDAIELDFVASSSLWDMRIEMRDPETGKAFGFPYQKKSRYMHEQTAFSVTAPPKEGESVDFVFSPMLRIFGENASVHWNDPYRDLYSAYHVKNYSLEDVISPLIVVVDQFTDETDDEAEEVGDERPYGQGADD